MKKLTVKTILDMLDDVGIFVLTLVCVFISSYVPIFQKAEVVKIDFSFGRFLIAAVLALLLTGVFELKGIVNADDLKAKAQAKAGRRKNAWLRIVISIVLGLCWPSVVAKVSGLLGIG